MEKIKVVYITGSGRSGSTLLGRILGEFDSIINIGEASSYFYKNTKNHMPCGCGAEVLECTFWNKIVNYDFINKNKISSKFLRLRTFFNLYIPFFRNKYSNDIQNYSKGIEELYKSIIMASKMKIIIDSSKNPIFVKCLINLTNIDLYILHLVREPGGYIKSRRDPKMYLQRSNNSIKSSLIWFLENLASFFLERETFNYKRVFYTDLTESPELFLLDLLNWLKLETTTSPIYDVNQINFSIQHILAGNPDKFLTGITQIHQNKREPLKNVDLFTKLISNPFYNHIYKHNNNDT